MNWNQEVGSSNLPVPTEICTKGELMFEITNDKTSKTIILEGDGFAELQQAIDISSAKMLEKALKETDLRRKQMMLLYAKRKREIETSLVQPGGQDE